MILIKLSNFLEYSRLFRALIAIYLRIFEKPLKTFTMNNKEINRSNVQLTVASMQEFDEPVSMNRILVNILDKMQLPVSFQRSFNRAYLMPF